MTPYLCSENQLRISPSASAWVSSKFNAFCKPGGNCEKYCPGKLAKGGKSQHEDVFPVEKGGFPMPVGLLESKTSQLAQTLGEAPNIKFAGARRYVSFRDGSLDCCHLGKKVPAGTFMKWAIFLL